MAKKQCRYLVVLKGLENVSEFLDPSVNRGQECLNFARARRQVHGLTAFKLGHLIFYQSKTESIMILQPLFGLTQHLLGSISPTNLCNKQRQQVPISPTFYELLFHSKVFWAAFLY